MDENKLFQICIGKIITRKRNDRGMSQNELAHRSGVDRSHIINIEHGVCNPGMQSLAAISDALGWRLSFLISKAEKLFDRELDLLTCSSEDGSQVENEFVMNSSVDGE